MMKIPRHQGAILIISLVFLLLLTIIGVTALQTDTLQEKMTGNLKDKQLAFQAVEAALRNGEAWLASASTGELIPLPLDAQGIQACNVLKRPSSGDPIDIWHFDWNTLGCPGPDISNIYERPRYFIEEVTVYGSLVRGFKYAQPNRLYHYRITGHGTGGTLTSETILQSDYLRP